MILPTTKSASKKSRKRTTSAKVASLNRATAKQGKARGKSIRKPRKSIELRQVLKQIEIMRDANELLLPKLFSEQAVQALAQQIAPDSRQRAFTVAKTLSLFIQQVLSKDRGCQDVVRQFNKRRKSQDADAGGAVWCEGL